MSESGVIPPTEDTPLWQAVHTLISSAIVPLSRVGFLPVIPKPITEVASCHQLCLNLENIRRQVNQPTLPIWCDEQVYEEIVDLLLFLLSHPDKFKNLFPCMGPFHMTRILQRCAGKLLRGSGLDDLLIECGIFGQGVMETVLNGKHYYRALAGLLMLEDLIGCLQWKAFFLTHDHTDYPYFHVLENLAKSLTENKEQATEFNEAIAIVGPLKRDFNEFLKTCEARSEVCKFLGILLYIISLVKNLVASDREGNWDLHVSTVADAIPIFKECDCLHYLRNGGYYSETIKAMEFSDPWLFRKFKSGLWAIQEKSGKFRAVGGVMKMEQGLQCVSKGPGGHYVVGLSGNAAAVAEFELLFPEAGKIASLLSMIIAESSSQHRDFLLQSCFNKKRKHVFNLNVISLLDFISAERNMYTVTTATPLCPTPLHNFMNSQKVDTQRAARLLSLVENG